LGWLRAGSSSVQRQALRDFHQALGNWWSGTHRRPTWRRRGQHEGFCVRDVTVCKLNRRWAELGDPEGRSRAVASLIARPVGPAGQTGDEAVG
jgi:putative transposase